MKIYTLTLSNDACIVHESSVIPKNKDQYVGRTLTELISEILYTINDLKNERPNHIVDVNKWRTFWTNYFKICIQLIKNETPILENNSGVKLFKIGFRRKYSNVSKLERQYDIVFEPSIIYRMSYFAEYSLE